MALASDITDATYRGVVQATNSSSATTNIAVPFTANTSSWITNGILNATATNAVAQSDTGADIPFMPGYGSNPWVLYYDSIGATSDRDVTLYLGNVSGGDIVYFPAGTGLLVNDNALLEGTNNYNYSFAGFFNTSLTGYLIYKSQCMRLNSGSGNVTADLYTGGVVVKTISSVCSTGYHSVQMRADGTNLYLDIDGVNKASVALAGHTLVDTATGWQIASGTPVIYMLSANITIGGVLKESWDWEYGSTFTGSVNSIVGTPTFRTTSSDADVSAALTMFAPISTATVDTDTASSWPSIITTVPTQSPVMYTENTSPGIFFAPIIEEIWPYSGLPNSFFWYCFAFTFIIGAGILVYAVFATKGYSAMLIKVIIMMAVMIFFSVPGPNIYGGYVPIYFGMWSFGILVLSKQYGW